MHNRICMLVRLYFFSQNSSYVEERVKETERCASYKTKMEIDWVDRRRLPLRSGYRSGRVDVGMHGIKKCQTIRYHLKKYCNTAGRKLGGGAMPLWGRGAGSLPNTIWPGPSPASMQSFILIIPSV